MMIQLRDTPRIYNNNYFFIHKQFSKQMAHVGTRREFVVKKKTHCIIESAVPTSWTSKKQITSLYIMVVFREIVILPFIKDTLIPAMII